MSQTSDTCSVGTSSLDSSIEHLSENSYIYKPRSQPDSSDASPNPSITLQAPNLILLFSWTGAHPKHIAKYTSGYIDRFPSTPIIVIQTSINDLIYRTSAKKRRSLLPAINAITASPSLQSNILLHAFSEGGSSTSVHFAKAFLAATKRRLPITAKVLDSCPGTLHFTSLAKTARNTVPNNPTAQVLGSLVAYTIIASYWTTFLVVGNREDVEDPKDLYYKTKVSLNDPKLWNTMAPRAYLFSKADKLIGWKSVLEHARSSELRGTPVFVEVFDKSAHCAHIRAPEDATRYWKCVQKVWDAGVSGSRVGAGVGYEKKDGLEIQVTDLGDGSQPMMVKKRCTCSDCGVLEGNTRERLFYRWFDKKS